MSGNRAVAQSNHKHRLSADSRAHVVAVRFDLRLVGDISPAFLKNMLHLQIEYGFICVNGAVDFELMGFINDPMLEVGGRIHHFLSGVFKRRFSLTQ